MALKTERWDVVEYLDDDDAIAAYLDAVLEEGDPQLLAAAIGDVARARGMTDIARSANLSRESLYKALSGTGNPEFSTIMKVLQAMGLRISIRPVGPTPDADASAEAHHSGKSS
ncbi:addiction module antidote protein [Arvimicrobium flavum]|uniref:addiction module antidote protein n=1 Tax=Arvimicrobium flavum TaxID=3393320 RepID=UPI00237B75E9|nr:addiction module antidote protein [Mesorhizobium shangrilense]